jgi:hypothetical protein
LFESKCDHLLLSGSQKEVAKRDDDNEDLLPVHVLPAYETLIPQHNLLSPRVLFLATKSSADWVQDSCKFCIIDTRDKNQQNCWSIDYSYFTFFLGFLILSFSFRFCWAGIMVHFSHYCQPCDRSSMFWFMFDINLHPLLGTDEVSGDIMVNII